MRGNRTKQRKPKSLTSRNPTVEGSEADGADGRGGFLNKKVGSKLPLTIGSAPHRCCSHGRID
jgi:hypothetical protein